MVRLSGVVLVPLLALLACPPLAYSQTPAATPAAEISADQIRVFLKDAKVVKTRTTSKGVTSPKRLTLNDGTIEHDAVFQAIDEHKMVETLGGGGRQATTELNFVDSYKYNIAAYEIARLLDLDHMMPVYVERKWNGQTGSISWFVPSLMDESDRLKKKIQPPNPTDWNYQMYRMRAFSSLLRDTDRNLTNVLITHQWKVMMIDFTRAFRLQPELLHEKDLQKIDRNLLAKMESLTRESVKSATKDYLKDMEIDAMMKRRDLLVAHFKKLIADLGEEKVLY
ncbi:MAG TPA: hypothetical protein VM096_10995 [Vicinamibacterales bacterium]|nr:hypothetical protein [Vicinamibacterales bacterium]